jgi:uncharacterized damage-inducible protein DinB
MQRLHHAHEYPAVLGLDRRFTGVGEHPSSLDAILHEDLKSLARARRVEDERITGYIDGLSEADLAGTIRYRTIVNPTEIIQPLAAALAHFFNHQTTTAARPMPCLRASGRTSLT